MQKKNSGLLAFHDLVPEIMLCYDRLENKIYTSLICCYLRIILYLDFSNNMPGVSELHPTEVEKKLLNVFGSNNGAARFS